MKLAGRTAIVTGASQGIGFAVAEKLVAEGCSVVVADIRDAALVAARLEGRAGAAMGLPLDVTSEDQVAATVAETVARFGSIDILVNNAAIASELVPGPFEESSPAEWRRILDVNVVGTFLMCRASGGGSSMSARERRSRGFRVWRTTSPARARSSC